MVNSASLPKRQRLKPRMIRKRLGEGMFVAPALIIVGLIVLLPAAYALYRSLFNWDPGYASPYVGLHNYAGLFNSQSFREILENEAFYLIGVPIWTAIPLAVSLLLYERVRFAGIMRWIMLFPAIVSPAILALFFRAILLPDGLLNSTLHSIGLTKLEALWIENPSLVKPVLIIVMTWATMGIGVLIFSAALSSVPEELFEAAQLDGANWWRRLVDILIPSISSVIVFYVILQVLTVFLGLFPWVYVLTQGGPGYSSTSMDFDIYSRAFTYGEFGQAAAESVILVGVVVLVVVTAWLLSRAYRRVR